MNARHNVYLIDGTYELFRHFYGVRSHLTPAGREVGATRGVIGSIVGMLEEGVRHLGVATDQVIESFRNGMWPGYKTGAGIDPLLWQQFPLLEEGVRDLGVTLWAMVELEADDALASAAVRAAADPGVERVYICTPDKDLAQCVSGDRIVQLERRTGKLFNEAGVIEKFGVPPASIPDYLALVGDSADGFPGLPGWGARSTAAVLGRYGTLETIPPSPSDWDIPNLRGASRLAQTLYEQRDLVMLFRDLARLRLDAPVFDSVDELAWQAPTPDFASFCEKIDAANLLTRVGLTT